MNRAPIICTSIASASVLLAAAILSAGPLDPPAGPVAPSYKTLTEVEPRTAINASNTPGDNATSFRITKAGSYYLTQNIQMSSGKHGIATTIADVTIDLNGFTITGISGTAYAILGYNSVGRIKVRNGRIHSAAAVGISVGEDSEIEDISVDCVANGLPAIIVGDRSVVRRCEINGSSTAFGAGSGCTFEDCLAVGVGSGISAAGDSDLTVRNCRFAGVSSSSGTGILAGDRLDARAVQTDKFVVGISCTALGTIDGCTCSNGGYGIESGVSASIQNAYISNMSARGIWAQDSARITSSTVLDAAGYGILVGNDCTIALTSVIGGGSAGVAGISGGSRNTLTDCSCARRTGGGGFAVSDGNTLTNCRADENSGDGFNGRFGNVWYRCDARSNTGDGIESSVGGTITLCRVDSSGAGAAVGANIKLTGDSCRVEDNALIGADFGIQTTIGGSTIHRNCSRGSANNYGGISGGNDVGPIGPSATATSPWANIAY